MNFLKKYRHSKRQWIWRVALLLFLCRVPFLVEFYPGNFFYDTSSSVEQFFGYKDTHIAYATSDPTIVRSNHHPVIYTVLFGGTIALGNAIGSQNVAMFLFLLLQAGLTAWVVARLLWLARRRTRIPTGVMIGIYALYPVFGFWSTMMLKDPFFAMATLWLMIPLAAIGITRGRIARRPRFLLSFFLLLLLFELSKNQGVYIAAFIFAYCLVLYWRQWRVPAVVLSAVLTFQVFVRIVLPACHVAQGGKQELYGFMFQQVALYAREHPNEATPEERAGISRVLPFDTVGAHYVATLQDSVKFRYNVDAASDDYARFFSAYFSLMKKHPETYLKATWANCDAYFHPTGKYVIAGDEFATDIENPDSIIRLKRWLDKPFIGSEKILHVPIIGLFFDMGFLVPLALLLCLYLIVRRRWHVLLMALPAFLSIGVLVLSPQNGCYRYTMPIVWALPMLLAAALPRHRQVAARAGKMPLIKESEDKFEAQTLSVIIPSYNEATTLPTLLERLIAVTLPDGFEKDIIIVDDGSTDDTPATAEAFIKAHPDERIRYVRQSENGGKGTAIRTGITHIAGRYVVIQDADLEYDPSDLATMLREMTERDLPVLYGSRFLRAENKHSSQAFYYGGRLVSATSNLLYGTLLTDEPTCYKMFRSELLTALPLRCKGFEFCPEVTARTARRGIVIAEVPISYTPRSFAEGKKISWRDGMEAIWTLVRYRI